MDSVRLRLDREQPLTFIEFNYMVLMAYDFVMLHRDYGCRLQMGGSDQWGQYHHGGRARPADGRRRALRFDPAADHHRDRRQDGQDRPGRSLLNADMTSAYDYWQFWRNTHDADVREDAEGLHRLPLDEIARLEALGGAEINDAKKVLADEATALLHGKMRRRPPQAPRARPSRKAPPAKRCRR